MDFSWKAHEKLKIDEAWKTWIFHGWTVKDQRISTMYCNEDPVCERHGFSRNFGNIASTILYNIYGFSTFFVDLPRKVYTTPLYE